MDKSQDLQNVLVVRVEGVVGPIEELSGLVSGDHLWLNSINRCRFIAHVPLDDEKTRIEIQPLEGSLIDFLRRREETNKGKSPSAIFDTVPFKDNQRSCALLFSAQ